MSTRNRTIAGLIIAAIVAGCSGGGGSHSVPASQSVLNSAPFATSATFVYGKHLLKNATPGAPVKLGSMEVDVQLTSSNLQGLMNYAQSASNPTSALYRHFLTPAQIGAQFGAPMANYKAAVAYFAAQGLKVMSWQSRLMLMVTGPQANMEKAFGTTFVSYTGPDGHPMYGPSGTPHFLTPLAGIHSVSRLIYDPTLVRRNALQIPPHGASPNLDLGYPVQQLAAAFDYSGAYNSGYTGTGIKIGIIGTGPIDAADYTAYKNTFSTGATNTITQVDVGTTAATQVGGNPTATPPPVTGPSCTGSLPSCNPEDGEAQIDTQQTAALAPSASILFYLAYVPDDGPAIGISENNDEVQQALDDNNADVISISYGIAEQYSDYTDNNGEYLAGGTEETQFMQAAAQGMAVFVSSGDAGAQLCADPYYGNTGTQVITPDENCVSAPAIDPNVVSVGGITTPLDTSGRQIGPFTTWGLQTNQGYGATGGGVSVAGVPLPSYQHGPGITGSTRNQPDIALEADPITGVAVEVNSRFGGGPIPYGGTSVAAPEAAAMWALVLDACRQTSACVARGTGSHPYRLGNPNGFFYPIYNNSTEYPAVFLDIVDGNNGTVPCLVNPNPQPTASPPLQGYVSPCPATIPTPDPGFNAGVGYDHTTGIGVPFARHLITQVLAVASGA
jgi:subtilase family serine protease